MPEETKTFDVSKPVTASTLAELARKHNSAQHLHAMVGVWLQAQSTAKDEKSSVKEAKTAKTKKKVDA